MENKNEEEKTGEAGKLTVSDKVIATHFKCSGCHEERAFSCAKCCCCNHRKTKTDNPYLLAGGALAIIIIYAFTRFKV
jgi:hypothetical protein